MKHVYIFLMLLIPKISMEYSQEPKFEVDLCFDDDKTLLYTTTYCEARGEGVVGTVAVLDVIKNRILHSKFPSTVDSVILQRKQFYVDSCKVTPPYFRHLVDSLWPLPSSHSFLYFASLKDVKNKKIKKWIKRHKLHRIGKHHFFK